MSIIYPSPPYPQLPYNNVCVNPPYNATNFTSGPVLTTLKSYGNNCPNYPWNTGTDAQQIHTSRQNISYFNGLNQQTSGIKTFNSSVGVGLGVAGGGDGGVYAGTAVKSGLANTGGGGGGFTTAAHILTMPGGSGGVGGGGAGGNVTSSSTTTNAIAGTVNTGGGGGGCSRSTATVGTGQAGGSGIVIIRYPNTFKDAVSVSNGTKTTANSHTIYTFTTSGSITF